MDNLPILFKEMAARHKASSESEISDEKALQEVKEAYTRFTNEKKAHCQQIEHELSVWEKLLS